MSLVFTYDDVEQALFEKTDIEKIYILERYKILKSELVIGDRKVFIKIEVTHGLGETKTGNS